MDRDDSVSPKLMFVFLVIALVTTAIIVFFVIRSQNLGSTNNTQGIQEHFKNQETIDQDQIQAYQANVPDDVFYNGIIKDYPVEPNYDYFGDYTMIPANYYYLDDGANGEMSLQNNMCSKSCCSEQYPTPITLEEDPFIAANKDKFVPNKIFCNSPTNDAGCMCITKDQARFLQTRGGNGSELF